MDSIGTSIGRLIQFSSEMDSDSFHFFASISFLIEYFFRQRVHTSFSNTSKYLQFFLYFIVFRVNLKKIQISTPPLLHIAIQSNIAVERVCNGSCWYCHFNLLCIFFNVRPFSLHLHKLFYSSIPIKQDWILIVKRERESIYKNDPELL
jgi:hypothetical protein